MNKKILFLFSLLLASIAYSQCSDNILNWVQTRKDDPNRGGFGFNYGSDPYVVSDDDAGGTTIAKGNFAAPYTGVSITTNKLEFDIAFDDYNDGLTTELWVNGVKYMNMVIPRDNDPTPYYIADYNDRTVYAPATAFNGAMINGQPSVQIQESKRDAPAASTGWVKNHIVLTFPSALNITSGSIEIRNYYPYLTGTPNALSQGDYRYYIKLAVCTPCTTDTYLSQGPNNGVRLYKVNTTTNPFTYPAVGSSSGVTYNALGAHPKDGYLYAMLDNSNAVLKINPSTGEITNIGNISGLPSIAYSSGEIDQNGNYYVKAAAADNKLYKINLATLTATTITLNSSFSTSDFAYNINNGLLYGVNAYSFGLGIAGGQLFSINPANGNVIPIGTVGSDIGDGNGTGAFIDLFGSMLGAAGDIYGVLNGGGFYKFNISTGERTLISSSPSLSNGASDGAHCVNSPFVFAADLYVTKTDGKTSYTAGSVNTYTIVAGNNGPFGVQGAVVADAVPAGIPAANVSYTAVVSGGAVTAVSGTMTGAINDIVNLPVGGKVTYTVTVSIPSSLTGNLNNTVSITSPANSTDSDTGNNTATDTDTYRGVCARPGDFSIGGQPTKMGITIQQKQNAWPENIPNGFMALESKTKGLVITRVQNQNSITDPKEGMLMYDIEVACVKLYNGTTWNCIKNTCSTPAPRRIKIGRYAGYTIGDTNFAAFNSQLTNTANYGPTGTFKGVTGFDFSDIAGILATSTGVQLRSNFDIINTGYNTMSAVQAKNISDFVKEGGVAIINLDTQSAFNFNVILNAFGITGSNGTGAINAQSSSVQQLSDVFGDTRNIALSGAATQGRVAVSQLPAGNIIYASETASGGGAAVWTLGGEYGGRAIFIWDEGLFRATASVAGTAINTPQEKFIHNIIAYALGQLGFQPQN